MNRRLALCIVVVITIVSVAACGPQPLPVAPTPIPTLAPATLPVATATEPSPAGTTPAETPNLAEVGRQVFEQNCAGCHNLTAETKVGPGLAGLFTRQQLPNGGPVNDENLRVWIQNGGGGMPGFALDGADLAAVIAFLKDATQ